MLAAFRGLPRVLLILSLVLNSTLAADTGCENWIINGNDVCCEKCKPGNRLVERCGRDPEKLCTPCEPGTYVIGFTLSCLRCTQCIGNQFTDKPCTYSSDTVCGCKDGYRCGNKKCSYCVIECKVGEEPTKERSCRKCPEGKFNDKIHSTCKEWRKSCPDGQTLVEGSVTSDSTCTYKKDITSNNVSTVKQKNEKINWVPVFIAAGMAGLAVIFIITSIVACVKAQKKTEKQPKTDTSDQDNSDESRIMVVEQEDCSFRHPEQEQGGSSDSINTQDSESKLIV